MSSRRSAMTLYSSPQDAQSHRARLAIAEKGLQVGVIHVEAGALPEDLLDLNPYGSLPTLVDRDLVLYDARVIMEYIDERFPHPPLMPVDPVSRARFRLMLYRIERDWYALAGEMDGQGNDKADRKQGVKLRKVLRDSILAAADAFQAPSSRNGGFFMGNEFSLLDASIAPILWRLPHYDIDLPPQAQAVTHYANQIFARPTFRESLSPFEQEMR